MLIKVFSLKFDALIGSFDDTPVRDFTQDKEILQVRDHLLIRNEIPYLVLVIKYYPYRKEAEERPSASTKRPEADAWKKEITEADLPLFISTSALFSRGGGVWPGKKGHYSAGARP